MVRTGKTTRISTGPHIPCVHANKSKEQLIDELKRCLLTLTQINHDKANLIAYKKRFVEFRSEMNDVIFRVSEGERTEEIRAHRVVLAAASEFFHTMFTTGFVESQGQGVSIINISENIDAFREVVNYCYTLCWNFDKDEKTLVALIVLCDKYLFPDVARDVHFYISFTEKPVKFIVNSLIQAHIQGATKTKQYMLSSLAKIVREKPLGQDEMTTLAEYPQLLVQLLNNVPSSSDVVVVSSDNECNTEEEDADAHDES